MSHRRVENKLASAFLLKLVAKQGLPLTPVPNGQGNLQGVSKSRVRIRLTAQPATGPLCGTFAVMRGARGDHGSVAGLRFARSKFPGTSAAPLETRSGSCIYDGGASSYHDWEFCTNLRLIAAKRAKLKTPDLEKTLADERDEVEPDPASSESALGLP